MRRASRSTVPEAAANTCHAPRHGGAVGSGFVPFAIKVSRRVPVCTPDPGSSSTKLRTMQPHRRGRRRQVEAQTGNTLPGNRRGRGCRRRIVQPRVPRRDQDESPAPIPYPGAINCRRLDDPDRLAGDGESDRPCFSRGGLANAPGASRSARGRRHHRWRRCIESAALATSFCATSWASQRVFRGRAQLDDPAPGRPASRRRRRVGHSFGRAAALHGRQDGTLLPSTWPARCRGCGESLGLDGDGARSRPRLSLTMRLRREVAALASSCARRRFRAGWRGRRLLAAHLETPQDSAGCCDRCGVGEDRHSRLPGVAASFMRLFSSHQADGRRDVADCASPARQSGESRECLRAPTCCQVL